MRPAHASVFLRWQRRLLVKWLRLKAFRNFRPVHHVPPCGDEVGAAVLVVEVVSVFPDIEPEDGFTEIGVWDDAFHERVVLVWGAGNFEFTILQDQPCPAGAETFGRGFAKSFFESVHGAEAGGDGGGEFVGRRAGCCGRC